VRNGVTGKGGGMGWDGRHGESSWNRKKEIGGRRNVDNVKQK
jgi:hypothetical protein